MADADPPGPLVQMQRVSRWYGPVIGLNDVSTSLGAGVTGLLGPNGAGKSTFLKLVTGQLLPSQGQVRVFGEPVFANPAVLGKIGMSPEHEELYDFLTGRRHAEFLLRLGGFRASEAKQRAAVALDRVGLSDKADRRVGTYSKGMRQRLRIAQAIAHDPPLVVLDEPLTGLDPVGRREVIDLIREMALQGRAILLSGHVLHEVEKMTRRIILIHRGRVLAEGTLDEIRKALDQRPHHVRVSTEKPRELARQLLLEEGVIGVRVHEDTVAFETQDPERFFRRLMRITATGEVPVQSYEATDDNLQSIFDYLVA